MRLVGEAGVRMVFGTHFRARSKTSLSLQATAFEMPCKKATVSSFDLLHVTIPSQQSP